MVAPFSCIPREVSEQDRELLVAGIESAFASAGNSSVKPQYLIREYLAPMGRSLDDAGDTEIALALAQELGVLRLVQPCISLYSGTWSLNLTLKDTTDGGRIASETFTAETPQELLNRLETPGFAQTFALELPGFTPFDLSFFLFLALELLLAGLLILRPRPLFNQILIILGGTLFLFAWFFARNANMDYVQRFVAHGGSLKVASSTARQQLEVAFRFLPLLVTNIILYLFPGGPPAGPGYPLQFLRPAAFRDFRFYPCRFRPGSAVLSRPYSRCGFRGTLRPCLSLPVAA